MDTKQILASLNKIANELDNLSLNDEADKITNVMTKIAQSPGMGDVKQVERMETPAKLDLSKRLSPESLREIKFHFQDQHQHIYEFLQELKSWADYIKYSKIPNYSKTPINMKIIQSKNMFENIINRLEKLTAVNLTSSVSSFIPSPDYSLIELSAAFRKFVNEEISALAKFKSLPIINDYINTLRNIDVNLYESVMLSKNTESELKYPIV